MLDKYKAEGLISKRSGLLHIWATPPPIPPLRQFWRWFFRL